MNFTPVNGLRLLAVETAMLIAFTVIFALLVTLVRGRLGYPKWSHWLVGRQYRPVVLVIAIALLGRATLLPWVGVPQPRINDEYSYLLMGDTFAHLRMTNPTPADWQHFETFHVNMLPTYHSKYPVSQGLALGFGEFFFRQPWVGVWLSTALLCGAICWALQAFVPPAWALIGGLLAVLRLGLLSYWVNSYWGGSMAALGGAVALGAVVRLGDEERTARTRAWLAIVFAIGLLLLATSRPFEGFAFAVPLIAYYLYRVLRLRRNRSALMAATLPLIAAVGVGMLLMAYYNRQTTGSSLTMPYVLNERTYAQLPLFFGQHTPKVEAHDPVFEKYYVVEAEEHKWSADEGVSSLVWTQIERLVSNWFFYIGPALSIPFLLGMLVCVHQSRLRLVLAAMITTAAAVAFCIFYQAHYFAPATITIYVFVATGLNYLWEQRSRLERAFAIAACVTVLVACLTRNSATAAMNASYHFPNTREEIAAQLLHVPGKHLVVVTYDMQHHYPGDELVHNGADFNSERILWARSKGSGRDAELCANYSDRKFWSVVTDDVSYTLTPIDLCGSSSASR